MPETRLSLRLLHGGDIAIGPGKADLLDAVTATGSISGAARAMGLSYRRAWLLVATMNRAFAVPLVATAKGGGGGGGATLTGEGEAVLNAYRRAEAAAGHAAAGAMAEIVSLLNAGTPES